MLMAMAEQQTFSDNDIDQMVDKIVNLISTSDAALTARSVRDQIDGELYLLVAKALRIALESGQIEMDRNLTLTTTVDAEAHAALGQ